MRQDGPPPAPHQGSAAAFGEPKHVGLDFVGAAYTVIPGFDGSYTVNFVTIITLYTIATGLYWAWFRATDRRASARGLIA